MAAREGLPQSTGINIPRQPKPRNWQGSCCLHTGIFSCYKILFNAQRAHLGWLVAVELGLDEELQPVVGFGTFPQEGCAQLEVMEFAELHDQGPLPSGVTGRPAQNLTELQL